MNDKEEVGMLPVPKTYPRRSKRKGDRAAVLPTGRSKPLDNQATALKGIEADKGNTTTQKVTPGLSAIKREGTPVNLYLVR